jgi:hypothetical protein
VSSAFASGRAPLAGTQRVHPWMLACRVPRHDGPPERLPVAHSAQSLQPITRDGRQLEERRHHQAATAIGAFKRDRQTAAAPPRASVLAPKSRAVARWFCAAVGWNGQRSFVRSREHRSSCVLRRHGLCPAGVFARTVTPRGESHCDERPDRESGLVRREAWTAQRRGACEHTRTCLLRVRAGSSGRGLEVSSRAGLVRH